jgi:hypothetical protein
MATADMRDLRDPNARPPEANRAAETTTVSEGVAPPRAQERREEVVFGGSVVEVIGGVATMVLAIIGLAGAAPMYLTAVGVIVLGAALVMHARSRSGRLFQLLSGAPETHWSEQEFSGGMMAEFLAGIAGIVLGILSLVAVVPWVLLPVAAIVYGAMLLVGRSTATRFIVATVAGPAQSPESELSRQAAGEMVAGANAAHVLVGIAAIVLGIVGLASAYPYILTLVALLVVGAFVVATRAALGGRMCTVVHR